METAKEKKIREAYEAEGVDWELKKDYVDEEGFIHASQTNTKQKTTWEWKQGAFCRPKSLLGIEHNNGWKVYAEEQPKESGVYVTAFMNHEPIFQSENFYSIDQERFFTENGVKIIPTHWRPKETYPNPIY